MLLPLTSAPERRGAAEPPARVPPAASARVLVVEDEDAVRGIVARTLRDHGYEVVQARQGREALARLAEEGEPIDLVLSDVVMPVMGGRDLAERLARDWPDIPVIWMSGYPRDTAFTEGAEALNHAFLQKPVAEEVLVRVIAEALAKGRKATGS